MSLPFSNTIFPLKGSQKNGIACVQVTETRSIIPAAAGSRLDPVPISGPGDDTDIIIGGTSLPFRDSNPVCK